MKPVIALYETASSKIKRWQLKSWDVLTLTDVEPQIDEDVDWSWQVKKALVGEEMAVFK